MRLLLRHLGEGPEGKGALHLAHVVLQDIPLGEGLRQVETVLDLQGLTHGPLLGARAHGAGRDTLGVPDVDGGSSHVAVEALLPEVEVDGGHRAAGHPRVEERVRHVEHGALDVVDLVAVVARDAGQAGLPDLRQLGLGEPGQRVVPLVPEPVAFTQIPELDS